MKFTAWPIIAALTMQACSDDRALKDTALGPVQSEDGRQQKIKIDVKKPRRVTRDLLKIPPHYSDGIYTEAYARKVVWPAERYCGETCTVNRCKRQPKICEALPIEEETQSIKARYEGRNISVTYTDYLTRVVPKAEAEICASLKSFFMPADDANKIVDLGYLFGSTPNDYIKLDAILESLGPAKPEAISWEDIPRDKYWEQNYDFATRAGPLKRINKSSDYTMDVVESYFDEPQLLISEREDRYMPYIDRRLSREEFKAQVLAGLENTANQPQFPFQQIARLEGSGDEVYFLLNRPYAESLIARLKSNPQGRPYPTTPYKWDRNYHKRLSVWRMHDFKNGRFPERVSDMKTLGDQGYYTRAFHEEGSDYLSVIEINDRLYPDTIKFAEINVLQMDMKNTLANRDVIKLQCKITIVGQWPELPD